MRPRRLGLGAPILSGAVSPAPVQRAVAPVVPGLAARTRGTAPTIGSPEPEPAPPVSEPETPTSPPEDSATPAVVVRLATPDSPPPPTATTRLVGDQPLPTVSRLAGPSPARQTSPVNEVTGRMLRPDHGTPDPYVRLVERPTTAEPQVVAQRAADPAPTGPPPAEPAPEQAAPPPAAVATPGAPAPAAPPPADPETLLATLYDPLLRRLRAELRIDRDRRGWLTDLPR